MTTQESQTGGPRVACGPRGRFVLPAMLLEFQIKKLRYLVYSLVFKVLG